MPRVKPRRRSPRRESLLSREQRIDGAMKLLGRGRADVEKIIDIVIERCERAKRLRTLESGPSKAYAARLRSQLGKTAAMVDRAPAVLRALLGLGYPDLGIEPDDDLPLHLRWAQWRCGFVADQKLTPKPDAGDLRRAAYSARLVCEAHGVKPVTTKSSIFCRLAAILHGDPDIDMQPYCIAANKRAARSKFFEEWRRTGAKIEMVLR
jgi:hypothetical protein